MMHDRRLGEGLIAAVDRVDDFQANHELYSDVRFYDGVFGKDLPK